MLVKQTVFVDKRTTKELAKFFREIQFKFIALFELLAQNGSLEEPFAKKLINTHGLFEIRVKHNGQWRALYAYLEARRIVILSAFAKKTQKTSMIELKKATKRMKDYK